MLKGNKIGNLTGIYDAKKLRGISEESWTWGLFNVDSDSKFSKIFLWMYWEFGVSTVSKREFLQIN